MMNEDELKEAMKQHMIKEYKTWLFELRLNRMEEENVLRTSERCKRNLSKIHTAAFDLFGEDFANSLFELDKLAELDTPYQLF